LKRGQVVKDTKENTDGNMIFDLARNLLIAMSSTFFFQYEEICG
jgi:hypothetical protein